MSWDSDRSGGGPRRRVRLALILMGLTLGALLLGPRVKVEERWSTPEVTDVQAYVGRRESGVSELRDEAAIGIEWAGPVGTRTPVALVYMHGFSADRHEIEPVVSMLADSLGANVLFTRLTGHGRDGAAMAEASVADWFDDAAEALTLGSRLGDRVVVIGTSTGGTLATWLATREEARGALAALVLVSPNFHPVDRTSRVLLWPWGGTIARWVTGPERCWDAENAEQDEHWVTCYPTEALLPMMGLVEHVRTMDLGRVVAPTLVIYSKGDEVVDAEETEAAFVRFGSTIKQLSPVPGGGDPSAHVLAGDILSPDRTAPTVQQVLTFLREAGVAAWDGAARPDSRPAGPGLDTVDQGAVEPGGGR